MRSRTKHPLDQGNAKDPAVAAGSSHCSPEQIRTAVSALRGRRPRPLDDGAGAVSLPGSGGRTRTPNDRTRTCCVADYTTPEGSAMVPSPGTSLPTRFVPRASRPNPKMRPAATPSASLMNRRHSAKPEIGLVRVGEVTASSPSSLAMRSDAERVERVRDEHHLLLAAIPEHAGGGRQRLPGRVTRGFAQDRARRGCPSRAGSSRPMLASVNRSPVCLPPVTTISGSDVLVVQIGGVVEPRLEHRRRRAVVLRGAEHDDRRPSDGCRRDERPTTPARTSRRNRAARRGARRGRRAGRASSPSRAALESLAGGTQTARACDRDRAGTSSRRGATPRRDLRPRCRSRAWPSGA